MQSKERGNDQSTFTIFTIPETFVHIDTGKPQKVTPEMYDFFQKQMQQNNVMHAFMTAIFHYVQGSSQAVDLERLEGKMEEVLQMLKGNNIHVQKHIQNQTSPVKLDLQDQPDHLDQLDELLDEFGG